MKSSIVRGVLACVLALLWTSVQAEDIDLFVGVPAGEQSELPNVLFVVDNTANWGSGRNPQPFTNLKAALGSTLAGLPLDRFRVGIMFYNETGKSNNNVAGGYVRAAIRTMNETNRNTYMDLVASLDPNDDKGNGAIGSLVMAEAWRYYSGGAAYAGNSKVKSDYTGNTAGTAQDQAVYRLHHNALSDFDATQYNSPLDGNSCVGNYIIYISNGVSTDNTSVKSQSRAMLLEAGGAEALEEIRINPSGLQDNPIDEWSRFMKQSDLDIATYTIEINPGSNNQDRNWTAVLESMADEGGGKYFPVSSAGTDSATASDITDAINRALSEIQAVNSVYASVSLPVSVNTQGSYLNQVFIGMFRPAQAALPRWDGNLKQYRLGRFGTSNDLQTLDADGNPAVNSSTGFIAECARSYWTPTTRDEYWQNLSEENCIGVPAASNSPDGNMVEKGAQGFMLRSMAPDTRTMYFESGPGQLSELTSTSLTPAQLGVATQAERSLVLDWLRGFNNNTLDPNDSDGFAAANGMRPSVHGDVVHSRPVAINYGTDAAPDVKVFYGANDGLLRAVNGNRNGGKELWSFLPKEFYPDIQRLRSNTLAIDYPGLLLDASEKSPKDYGFDGPLVAYQAKADASATSINAAWIFGGLRRGGRSLYAFDVSNPARPDLLWRIGCLDGTCTRGYDNLGQTWSSPAIAKSVSQGNEPVLIMGGGYDQCEDDYPHSCNATSPGNSLYVIDPTNEGAVLKEFATERGIVGDVTVVNDKNGRIQYAYTVDLGGNLYRLSGPAVSGAPGAAVEPIGSTPPSDWVLTKIAALGCDRVNASCDRNRKFLHAPDVVSIDSSYFILAGSGDREKPLGESSDVQNYFFMVKDRPDQTQSVVGLDALTLITTETPTDASLNSSRGWRLQLLPGEQTVTAAITVFGVVTFSTHEPAVYVPGQCSANLGIARVYNVGYRDAASRNDTVNRFELIVGGGLPPSPVAGMVQLDDGSMAPFIIGSRPDSPLSGAEPVAPDMTAVPRGRVYWNIEEQ